MTNTERVKIATPSNGELVMTRGADQSYDKLAELLSSIEGIASAISYREAPG